MRRRPVALAVAAALWCLLAACDTGDGRQMRPPTEPFPATTTTTEPPVGEPIP